MSIKAKKILDIICLVIVFPLILVISLVTNIFDSLGKAIKYYVDKGY